MANEPMDISNISPVFLCAPTARCGVTLLQRLITSTREILMYGEYAFLTEVFPRVIQSAERGKEESDAALERLATGDVNFWSSAAVPQADTLIMALRQSVYVVAYAFQATAGKYGYKRWGVKEPLFKIELIQQLLKLFQKAQFIFLYRDIKDVARSYKARGWLESDEKLGLLCSTWVKGVTTLLAIDGNSNTHVLRYESLMESPDTELDRLQTFLSCSDFDRSVLEVKVNTFEELAKDSYVEPEALTESEKKTIDAFCAETRKICGYT